MGPNYSTPTSTRIISARRTAERRSSSGPGRSAAREVIRIKPTTRRWRADDPPAKTIGTLGSDDIGKRVVIRSGNFIGTVYGTLLEVREHVMVHFTTVILAGRKPLTLRNDIETLVLG